MAGLARHVSLCPPIQKEQKLAISFLRATYKILSLKIGNLSRAE